MIPSLALSLPALQSCSFYVAPGTIGKRIWTCYYCECPIPCLIGQGSSGDSASGLH